MSVAHLRRPTRLVALAAAIGLCVAGAGCAKDERPTQEQYVAMADGVCRGTEEKLVELYEQHDVEAWEAAASGESNINVDRPERWVRARIVPEYERMSGSLKSIPPPEGDDTYLADLYADLDRRIAVLHNRPGDGRAAVNGDEQLTQRFASYGMEVCGTV